MVLAFFRMPDGHIKAVEVDGSTLIDVGRLDDMCLTEAPTKEALMKLTKEQMKSIFNVLHLSLSNFTKATKSVVADIIIKEWGKKISSGVKKLEQSQSSKDDVPKSSKDDVPKPVMDEAKRPSSGYELMVEHSKRASDEKGYRVFFMGSDLMISTAFGCYSAVSGDDADILQWMRTHNIMLLRKADINEENDSTIHDTNSSIDDGQKGESSNEDEKEKVDDNPRPLSIEEVGELRVLEELNEKSGGIVINGDILMNLQGKKKAYDNYIATIDMETATHPDLYAENVFEGEDYIASILVPMLFGNDKVIRIHYNKRTEGKEFYDILAKTFNMDADEYALVMWNGASVLQPYDIIFTWLNAGGQMRLCPRMKGGGGYKTIKSQLKKKGEKTLPTDKALFEGGFNTACLITSSTTFDLKKAFEEMECVPLQRLRDYLTKDKSINSIKLKTIYTFLPPFVKLQEMVDKSTASMECLKELVEQDIIANYATDDSDKTTVQNIKELIGNILAVKEYVSAHSDMKM